MPKCCLSSVGSKARATEKDVTGGRTSVPRSLMSSAARLFPVAGGALIRAASGGFIGGRRYGALRQR